MGSFKTGLIRYGILLLIAALCFSIAGFALQVWPAYAHYQQDYAQAGVWSAWFNGPVLDRDQKTVSDSVSGGAQIIYSLTGDLESVSAGAKTVKGAQEDLRYYLAATPADGQQLLGTWVASNSVVTGRKQSATPVIIDQRTARQLRVNPGDTITLEVKLTDERSNEVQGRFSALVTAVARPTSQFKGVALTQPSMERFVSSAQQVAATDFYVTGGPDKLPQDLADALAHDQIRGALRADMVTAAQKTLNGRSTALRFGIAGVALFVLGIYALGELYFAARSRRGAAKGAQASPRHRWLAAALDAVGCLIVFALTATGGIALSGALIRLLMAYEPVRATTTQTSLLFAFVSLALIVLRVLIAPLISRKRAYAAIAEAPDHD